MTDALALLVQHVADNVGLPSELVLAQVHVESGGDPFALRYEPSFFEKYIRHNPTANGYRYGPLSACSFGLLQIILETAIEIGFDGQPQDLFIDRIGLMWGAKYMKACWDTAGGTTETYPHALAMYNAGPGVAGPPWPNAGYVNRVYAAVRA